MREKIIEQHLVKAVKNSGGIAPKLVSHGFDGMPDRLVLLPGGKIGFVEVKAPCKEPRPLQVTLTSGLFIGFLWCDSKVDSAFSDSHTIAMLLLFI